MGNRKRHAKRVRLGERTYFAIHQPWSQALFTGADERFSYDAAAWAGTMPIQIQSVTFVDGSEAKQYAVVSYFGGKAEVNQYCPAYGGPFCIYPWFTLGATGYHYGVDFPDTLKDYGQADQFAQTTQCGGPFGPNTTYCATLVP